MVGCWITVFLRLVESLKGQYLWPDYSYILDFCFFFFQENISKLFSCLFWGFIPSAKLSAGLTKAELSERLSPPSYWYWWRFFLNVFACLAATFWIRNGYGYNKVHWKQIFYIIYVDSWPDNDWELCSIFLLSLSKTGL